MRAERTLNGNHVYVSIRVSSVENHRRTASLEVAFTPASCAGLS